MVTSQFFSMIFIQASQGRTTVIIAHRLSTVKNADQIAVVSNGRIVETGNHAELLLKRGEYFKLVMLQTFEETAEQEELNSELGSIISDSERGILSLALQMPN